jgi:hypothetical protein
MNRESLRQRRMTMEISPKSGKELRSRFGRIAAAIAFALMICSVAVGPVRADDHGDRGDRGHRDYRGDRGDRGNDVYNAPDYYYEPQPDYYYAPEPDYYNYSDRPRPEYYPRPQSEGLNLFFGIR